MYATQACEAPRASVVARALAIGEVVAAFALMHVGFRAFRSFTALGRSEVAAGLNFSPGVAMILVGLGIAALSRRSFPVLSGSARQVRADVALGAFATLLLAVCCALPWLAGMRHGLGEPMSRNVALALMLCQLATGAFVLRIVERGRLERGVHSERAAVLLAVLLLSAPCAIAFLQGRALSVPALTVAWLVVAAAGEEVFFRGYAQSRLNGVFGRPLELFGTRFGPGLFIAALLFGLIHVLNPYDTFSGEGRLSWWHGLAAAAAPFGLLRERTGALVAPFTFHLLGNLLPRIPALLQSGAS